MGRLMAIDELIAELQQVRQRHGPTPVYVRDLSWGAVAIVRNLEDHGARPEPRAPRCPVCLYTLEEHFYVPLCCNPTHGAGWPPFDPEADR